MAKVTCNLSWDGSSRPNKIRSDAYG